MIGSPIPGYIKEIEDVSWVQEIIMETFDGALELMGETSVVYGGAVRDCLAGMDLLGDLDIAVTRPSFSTISNEFQVSTKWTPKIEFGMGREVSSASEWGKVKGSGDLARTLAPMSGVTAFRGVADRIVQLITTKQHTKDPFQDVLYMARMVDIVCCGVVMTADGRVFEAVPGAYQDCKDRVLRLNESSDTIFVEALPERVDKLVKRGWKNTIDVKKALKDITLAQERLKKKQERQMAAMHRKLAKPMTARPVSMPMGKPTTKLSEDTPFGETIHEYTVKVPGSHHSETEGGYTSEIKSEVFTELFGGDKERMATEITRICRNHNANARIKWTPVGKVYVTAANYDVCRRIIHDIISMYGEQKKREERAKKPNMYEKFAAGVQTGRLRGIENPGRSLGRGMVTGEFLSGPVVTPKYSDSELKYRTKESAELVLRHEQPNGDTVDVHVTLPPDQAKSLEGSWRVMGEAAKAEFIKKLSQNAERIEIDE